MTDGTIQSSSNLVVDDWVTTHSRIIHDDPRRFHTILGADESFESSSRRLEEESNNNDEEDSNLYIPTFDGFMTFKFSIYIPDYGTDKVAIGIDIVEHSQTLDNLIVLFLCSKQVQLVISPQQDSIISACPFTDTITDDETNEDDGKNRRQLSATNRMILSHLESIADRFRKLVGRRYLQDELDADILDFDSNQLVLWNLPKIEYAIHELEVLNDEKDDDTVTGSYYYTSWNFTFPVYQRGDVSYYLEHDATADDSVIKTNQDLVQYQLDYDIQTGLLDVVLPWDNSQASMIGKEEYTFRNIESGLLLYNGEQYDANNLHDDRLVADDDYYYSKTTNTTTLYDNTISFRSAKLLQSIGVILVIINTIAVVLLTILAKRYRVQKEQREQEEFENRGHSSAATGLDTEEGVSEMLLESKKFALEKSQEIQRQRSNLTFEQKQQQKQQKENDLMVKAKTQHDKYGKQEFSDRLLVQNLSMDSEESMDFIDFRPPSPMIDDNDITLGGENDIRRRRRRRRRHRNAEDKEQQRPDPPETGSHTTKRRSSHRRHDDGRILMMDNDER